MVTPFAEGVIVRAAGRAPSIAIATLTGPGNVLVLTPHPDDESLGCGRAIAAASHAGREVLVVALTDGRLSHPHSHLFPADRLIALRQAELVAATAILTRGTGDTIMLGFPDQGAPEAPADRAAVRNRLLHLIDARNVSALWTTWEKDPHPDHRCAAVIAREVVRARPALRLWRFPVWGRFTEDAPGPGDVLYRFDGAPFAPEKRAALDAHRSQMTALIPDDPDGFVMDARARRHFLDMPELFLGDGGHV
ncbi:PIG-L deacetylase family protein [Gluconacetobacter takamatsuzukensis]|uniref:PIG-L family deacetylase n=1 Tax=Gluconacetobacter takamatsuzukensis TaxID=1286190 RepID=A0A7W4KGM2_9PROT|nr:PIG-L deacetylase family protein [Gluconacetobacter takamatsuzukensis]MBB2206599.1 PIG-L family deacetylase [Gluconacetobacter takamatsuzukensis]